MSRALRVEMPSRASSSSRQKVPSTSTTSLDGEAGRARRRPVGRDRVRRSRRRHSRGRGRRTHSPEAPRPTRPGSAARRRPPRTARPRGSTLRAASPALVPASATRPRNSAPESPTRDTRASALARRLRSPNTRTGVADSRRSRSPAVWSISASVRSTPAIGGARTPSSLLGCERLELLARVRRGVYEKPRPLATANRERRLRTRSRPYTRPRGLARVAVAIPLRKPSAGGRAENANAHVAEGQDAAPGKAPEATSDRCSYSVVHVERDLATEVDVLELGLDPRGTALRGDLGRNAHELNLA